MILINEWFPNPAGPDTVGEFVELFNSGKTPVNLSGWTLATGDRELKLNRTIDVGQYLLLKRSDTKFVLKNNDENVFLYDAGGKLVDESRFLGTAPEGKSFSRTNTNELTNYQASEFFSWSDPTPGALNKAPLTANIAHNIYPSGASLNRTFGLTEFWSLLLGTAVVLTAVIIFVLKQNENLSKLLFGRDEKIWP